MPGIKVCHLLVAGRWFSTDTTISSTNKTGHYNITEILLKVALNTITLTLKLYTVSLMKFNLLILWQL
jgi:hypothetical protein